MFDKLIESQEEGADVRNRRKYFVLSSLAVGVLFATAVVISIYAADISLGSSSFELVEMIAPVDPAPAPTEIKPAAPTSLRDVSRLPTRLDNMLRVEETPRDVPSTTSVIPNTQKARPEGRFIVGTKFETDPPSGGDDGRRETGPVGQPSGIRQTEPVAERERVPEPPPVQPKKQVLQSLGVVNGKATFLPKPIYSAAAQAVHAQGRVEVQVLIDENGNVVSANAVGGHPLLKSAAEKAARNARFTPTYLSNVAVKVTGVIVYNFTS